MPVDYCAVETSLIRMIAPIKKRLAQAFPIYELKITLCGSNPAIWRRVQVPGGIKLNRLHDVLQVVMGWTDSHLHQFRVGSVIYCLPSDDDFYPGGEQRDERRFRLADIAQREKTALIYEYDFGDGWEHEVVVEKVLAADSEKKCAVCLDGKNARPPEDCGGIFGYYDLLKAINNPKHAEHQQLLDWLGGPFDPSHFDLQETNTLLRGLKI
jgi:hypothetical protein